MTDKKLLLPGIIIVAILISDQLSKLWAVANLSDGSKEVLGDFLRLTLVYNEGGAMGTNVGSPIIYLILAVAILPVLIYYIWANRKTPQMSLPLSMIAGGALGNLTDRIRLGRVIDFLDVDFFDINLLGYRLDRWWTFNIADAAISCAIVVLLLSMFLQRKAPNVKADIPVQSAGRQ